ncbi:F-box/FBD/LRR-repeat protein At5g56420-like [Lathyrus oleraceus]|uniref:F-box/FBD/LRR-repeat protein At5g56420-like n=1 Tax=Pisum sativum TaxID=3888 RepID=UPI0021D0D82A|nr:F-box/FBD/LRR-repeat protein At5g56420-like [Pisum sativum]
MADRISEFHDSILSHILSFLPTKHAATTSILSKRWKSLWLSVLTLDFDCKTFKHMASFEYYIHKLMPLRKIELPILSLRFNCIYAHSTRYQNNINLFVSYVMNRGIENLNISGDMKLPSSILSCKTLKVLKLKGIIVNGFSHQVDFPVLKILHLKRMIFELHELLVKFLSGCKILEELETKYLGFRNGLRVPAEEFDGLLPSLVRAKISCHDSIIPLHLVRNVETLHMEQAQLKGCSKLPMFHNLTHLKLKFFYNMWGWLQQMLEQCHKLQSLIIQGCEYQDQSWNDQSWNDPPIVPKCLSLHLRTCCLAYCKGTESEFQFAKYILQNSKRLKTMKFKYNYCADIKAKHQMTMELSSFAKGSTMCEVVFENSVTNSITD